MAEKKELTLTEKIAPRVKETHSKEDGQEILKKAHLAEAMIEFSKNTGRILELRSEIAILELKNRKLIDKFPPIKYLKGNFVNFGKPQPAEPRKKKQKGTGSEKSQPKGEVKEHIKVKKASGSSAQASVPLSSTSSSSQEKRKSPEKGMEIVEQEFDQAAEILRHSYPSGP
jgi:hypothetical protein